MSSIRETIKEIVLDSQKNGLNPVYEVMDYMAEKGSRLTYDEARRIIERAMTTNTLKIPEGL